MYPMPRIPLAWKMLLREWRGGELGLLFASLVLGVALVTGISLFAERLQKALVGEASVYLGADHVLQVADPVNPDWLEAAQQQGLSIARTTLFPTMIYPVSADSDRAVLSALKAVSAGYPLHGDLALRDGNDQLETVQHGPTKGMAWVDSNILAQLDIKIGETVDIGNSRFIVERVLTREGAAPSEKYLPPNCSVARASPTAFMAARIGEMPSSRWCMIGLPTNVASRMSVASMPT